ncbi:hypothetical protein MXD62_19320 [Frankia sp. Mgl5]|uniref:hypothetical protein n=1 Tax=Frankia sp. Mgl5 TaxID=2933793 RepID=UPI00200E8360|nr:hypothetical protein [Frankia sp. Mgl5]MCK9929302.1 hypothetical protein [Frankia sp. Mgl5]
MRTRTRTVHVPGTHTVNGITAPVIRTQQITEPVPPRDWDAIALRAVTGLVVALTLFAVAWSTSSIARLLGGGPIGYLAALVFDAAWIITLGMAYLVRHRPDRRRTVDWVGWVLVAVTVATLAVEGWQTGGPDRAAAGAAVSLIAKALWWSLDRVTRAPLADLDRQWLAARLSQLATRRALVVMELQVAREEARVAALTGSAPPDPDRPRGSTQVDLDPPQVDPAPALESTPARPGPATTAQVSPPQVDPRSTRQVDPTPTPGRPDLHAVPDQVDPDNLDRARQVVADLRRDQVAPSTEQIRKRMGIGRDRARALWLAIQTEEADPARRTA